MGDLRSAMVSLLAATFLAGAIVACSSAGTGEGPATVEDPDAEPPRVPDPPPRYTKIQIVDAATPESDAEPALQIKCGRDKPYVCPLEDGTFACSSVPCLPDCSRIGCVGGDVCTSCEGGFRCLSPGEHC